MDVGEDKYGISQEEREFMQSIKLSDCKNLSYEELINDKEYIELESKCKWIGDRFTDWYDRVYGKLDGSFYECMIETNTDNLYDAHTKSVDLILDNMNRGFFDKGIYCVD